MRDADPFAFFQPTLVVTDGERRQLVRGEPIARTVPARGREVTVFSAVSVAIDADRLVAWVRRIEALKANKFVLAIRRFSNPPLLEDLDGLTLGNEDREAIRRCRRGDCGLKLSVAEMASLRGVAERAGDDWPAAVDAAFRELVLQRVQAYLGGGHAALPDLDDHRDTVRPRLQLGGLVERTTFLTRGLPRLAETLVAGPGTDDAQTESFLYWSKEMLSGKPVVAATHVRLIRHDDGVRPDVLVTGTGIFATHYATASLGVTALVADAESRRFLVYVNRSDVDVLDGFFGGFARRVLERRLTTEAASLLRGLKSRLESGDPP